MLGFRSVMHLTQLLTLLDMLDTYMVGQENVITKFLHDKKYRITYKATKRKNHFFVALEEVRR